MHKVLRAVLDLRATLLRLGKSSLGQNIASLFLVQCLAFALPMVTVPYLGRTLGPQGWGVVAYSQSFGFFVILAVEYGFTLAGTRLIAQNRHSRRRLGLFLAGIQGAKVCLAIVAVSACCLVRPFNAVMSANPLIFSAAMLWAVSQAMAVSWFLTGIEEIRFFVPIEIGARMLSVGAILLFVHRPEDAWKVLICQAGGAIVPMLIELGYIYWKKCPFYFPGPKLIRRSLVDGRNMLVFRFAESAYNTTGNPIILGMFQNMVSVGYFGGAEKICRYVFVGGFAPINSALFPRISNTLKRDREAGIQLIRKTALYLGGFGLVLSLIQFCSASLIVRLLLGPSFGPAVVDVRILSILPFAIAMKWVVGLHWMVSVGMEDRFNRIIVGSCVFHLILSPLLSWSFGHVGMAISVALVEGGIPLCIYAYLHLINRNPLQFKAPLFLRERMAFEE